MPGVRRNEGLAMVAKGCGNVGPHKQVVWDDGGYKLYLWQEKVKCGLRCHSGFSANSDEDGTWICNECAIRLGYRW